MIKFLRVLFQDKCDEQVPYGNVLYIVSVNKEKRQPLKTDLIQHVIEVTNQSSAKNIYSRIKRRKKQNRTIFCYHYHCLKEKQ